MCAIRRVVVVFPLVPETAIIGIRALEPAGYSISTTGSATFRGSPSVGAMCIRKPGAAFTSSTAPPSSSSGRLISFVMISIPQISSPIIRAIRSQVNTLFGCTKSVTSVEVPPVLKFAVAFRCNSFPAGNTDASSSSFSFRIFKVISSTLIAVSTFSWP
ncbi:MAG: hypothetical protein BWY67_01509 [Bacteroidetes bacterium ADurb.Bin397]|nr:MAG: hypothetical protein BWY67_01509 [Bacteroidetes bacterium ADurb.Bin397]